MHIEAYKFYNRPVHSFLLYVRLTPSVGEDGHIFVVQDESNPICDILSGASSSEAADDPMSSEEMFDPEESSAAEEPSASSEAAEVETNLLFTKCDGQPGIPETIVVPGNITAEYIKVLIPNFEDAYCYEVVSTIESPIDTSIEVTDSYTTCNKCLGSICGGENVVPEEPSVVVPPTVSDLDINPNRVLYTIASVVDILTYPTTSPGLDTFYRADNVALIFQSEIQMNNTFELILEDILINLKLQGIPTPSMEIFEAVDNTIDPPSNDDDVYLFKNP